MRWPTEQFCFVDGLVSSGRIRDCRYLPEQTPNPVGATDMHGSMTVGKIILIDMNVPSYQERRVCELCTAPALLWRASPALHVQKRIVAEGDKFMSLCDRLEGQLFAVQSKSQGLLESVINQALNNNRDPIGTLVENYA